MKSTPSKYIHERALPKLQSSTFVLQCKLVHVLLLRSICTNTPDKSILSFFQNSNVNIKSSQDWRLNCWALKILKNLIFDFAGKAPEVQSLELSFPVTSAHFQNNQVSSMVDIFRQRQIYNKRQRQCKDNDIETKIKKTQILILTWYTGAPEMFSHDSRPLLEDSRCNTKPGASKTASDQRRFVPYIYLLFLITNLFISLYLYIFVISLYDDPLLVLPNVVLLDTHQLLFLWEISKFVFPFVLPLPLVLPYPPPSSADKNRKV